MIPKELVALFSATIQENNGQHYVSVPTNEFKTGNLDSDKVYRIGLIEVDQSSISASEPLSPSSSQTKYGSPPSGRGSHDVSQTPPVSEGDQLEVKIESIGDKGDGVAKVDGGYVVIVDNADAQVGDVFTVEITGVQSNFAFSEPINKK